MRKNNGFTFTKSMVALYICCILLTLVLAQCSGQKEKHSETQEEVLTVIDPLEEKTRKQIKKMRTFIGKTLAGKHELKSLSLEGSPPVYFERKQDQNTNMVVGDSLIRFKWRRFYFKQKVEDFQTKVFQESLIHYQNIKFNFDDSVVMPYVKFKWKIECKDKKKRKSVINIFNENIIHVLVYCRKDQVSLECASKKGTKYSTTDTYVGKILGDIHRMKEFPETISGNNVYFRNTRLKSCRYITPYTLLGINWHCHDNDESVYSEFPAHMFTLSEKEKIDEPYVEFTFKTKNNEVGKLIPQVMKDHVSGVRVIIPKGTWPFDYVPGGNYDECESDEGRYYRDIHPLASFKSNAHSGTLHLTKVYFRPEKPGIFVNDYTNMQYKWLKNDGTTFKAAILPFGKFKVKKVDDLDIRVPVIKFRWRVKVPDNPIVYAEVICPKGTWHFDSTPNGEYQQAENEVMQIVRGKHKIMPFPRNSKGKQTLMLRKKYFKKEKDKISFYWQRGDTGKGKKDSFPFSMFEINFKEQKTPVVEFVVAEINGSRQYPKNIAEAIKNHVTGVKIRVKENMWPF